MSERSIREFKTVEEIQAELRRMNNMPRNYALMGSWRRRYRRLEEKLHRLESREKESER